MPRISRRLRDFKGSAESGVILALLGIRFNQMKLPDRVPDRSVLYRLGGSTVTCGAVSWILAKNSVRPGVVAPNFSGRRLVNSTVATSTVTPRRETFERAYPHEGDEKNFSHWTL